MNCSTLAKFVAGPALILAFISDFIFLINDQAVWQLTEDMAPGDIGLGVDVISKQDEAQVEFTGFEVRAP